ncbi:hypothetical protein GCM10011379_52430 [Filimonas zeae]|uniref:Uncharacterized protein n=1 Tax=Filimonas zeae TaxID=1737353 RepID=A0A917N0K8_9BACT|nr:hypothetical protein GCM10011379_52430 [Filimonas zeae]
MPGMSVLVIRGNKGCFRRNPVLWQMALKRWHAIKKRQQLNEKQGEMEQKLRHITHGNLYATAELGGKRIVL